MSTYVIKIGTDPDTAVGKYREFAGVSYFDAGDNYAEATALKTKIEEVWESYRAEDPAGFVYGTPSVSIIPLRDIPTHPFYSAAAQMAANWYLDKESMS